MTKPAVGATLKQIRDQTSVKVDIPKRDAAPTPSGNGFANGPVNGNAGHDEEEEVTIPVTLVGPRPLAYEAQAMIKDVIASRTSKSTQRVRDIPSHVLPFILVRKAEFLAAGSESGTVNLSLNATAREITASGDREAVGQAVEAIRKAISDLEISLTLVKISLPKRQHRLLSGVNADSIMADSKCAVVVAKPEEGDDVTVWGSPSDLPNGLSAVMTKANSKYIHEMPLPGPIAVSKQLATYFARIQYGKTLKSSHPTVEVYLPAPESKANTLSIDFIGEKATVDAAVKQVSELLGKLIAGTKSVLIDWLVHRVITGKNAKKLVYFQSGYDISANIFPD